MIEAMRWQAISQPAIRFVGFLAVAMFAHWLLRSAGIHDFTAREMEGLNTLILLIGNIYAVMYAFVIFVIWGQFNEVETFVMHECNSLNDLLRFSGYLNPDANYAIRRSVAEYVQKALKAEWAALGEGRRDKQTEKSFSEVIDSVLKAAPSLPGDQMILERLIDVVRKAGENRDERITKSLTRIPPTLIRFVETMAGALLLLVFLYPFHHWIAGVFCLALLAIILFVANLVMRDTDNPFSGIWNVSPKPFADLLLHIS